MGKPKGVAVTNRPLYSRISYLYQAGAYLAAQSQKTSEPVKTGSTHDTNDSHNGTSLQSTMAESTGKSADPIASSSRYLLSELRAVTLRSQIRLSPALKHSVCQRCNTILADGPTCSVTIENMSKGGKKEWADVLVRTCKNCNFQRRIPVGAKRQKRKPLRVMDKEQSNATGE